LVLLPYTGTLLQSSGFQCACCFLRSPCLCSQFARITHASQPDFGIVIDRPDPNVARTNVYVRKVRFEGTGDKGHVVLAFNRENSRFEQLSPQSNQPELV
jgi:hypothetical protein